MDAGVSSKAWITKYHFGELIMREGLFGGGNARDSGEEIEENEALKTTRSSTIIHSVY